MGCLNRRELRACTGCRPSILRARLQTCQWSFPPPPSTSSSSISWYPFQCILCHAVWLSPEETLCMLAGFVNAEGSASCYLLFVVIQDEKGRQVAASLSWLSHFLGDMALRIQGSHCLAILIYLAPLLWVCVKPGLVNYKAGEMSHHDRVRGCAGWSAPDSGGVLLQLAGHHAGHFGCPELWTSDRSHSHGCQDSADGHRCHHAHNDAGAFSLAAFLENFCPKSESR